jgi:hypothetical protein
VETTRLLLTILNGSKVVNGRRPPVDFSSITEPGIVDKTIYPEILVTLDLLGWRVQTEGCEFLLSTKSGPAGQALMGSISDYLAIKNRFPNLESSLRTFGGDSFSKLFDNLDWLTRCASWFNWYMSQYKIRHWKINPLRKISIVHDPEAKERPVAIFDYWSQIALKPFHEALFRLLRRIKGDCTFNQDSYRAWLPDTGPYFSLDLKNATDRLPASLQKSVVSKLLSSEERGEAWYDIMCSMEFSCPDGAFRKYSVGQPMGGYSSWAMLAVTHHLIVRTAAR